MNKLLFTLLAICALFCPAPMAHAHKVTAVSVIADIDTTERKWSVELAMNIDPSDDPTLNDEISPVDAATEYAENGIEVLIDDVQQSFGAPEIAIEDLSDENTPEELKRRQVIARITGSYPEGGRELTLRANEAFTPAIILLAIIDGEQERRTQSVFPGESSRPLRLESITPGDPFEAKKTIEATPIIEKSAQKSGFSQGFLAAFQTHWLSLVFVIAMVLPTMGKRSIFRQLIAFTAASAVGLCVPALMDLGSGISSIVSILVALSLLYAGAEGLFSRGIGLRRIVFTALFGLAHGFSFSSLVIRPTVNELVLFNIGLTNAYLLALLIAVAIAVVLQRSPIPTTKWVPAASAIVLGLGIFALVSGF